MKAKVLLPNGQVVERVVQFDQYGNGLVRFGGFRYSAIHVSNALFDFVIPGRKDGTEWETNEGYMLVKEDYDSSNDKAEHKHKVCTKLTDWQHEAVGVHAESDGVSVAEVIRQAVNRYV